VSDTQYVVENFVKKLLGKDKIPSILKRLDRLTKDEGLSTGAQTMGVVHRLEGNMNIVMRGVPYSREFLQLFYLTT
jgi:hypothetical protein